MTAPDLASLQRRLQAAILHREDKVAFLAGTQAAERLSVYLRAYRLRLTEALAVDYPMLARWLEEESFAKMAESYVAAFPSRARSIRWVGRHLPEFLRAFAPWRERPELAELAVFEWSLGLAFDCADADPLRPEGLARIPPQRWPKLRLKLHPSVRLETLYYPVPQVWKALQAGAQPPVCQRLDTAVTWLLWRKGLRMFFRSLAEPERFALQAVQAGQAFAEICAGLARWNYSTDVAQYIAGLLRQWLEEGLIVAVE